MSAAVRHPPRAAVAGTFRRMPDVVHLDDFLQLRPPRSPPAPEAAPAAHAPANVNLPNVLCRAVADDGPGRVVMDVWADEWKKSNPQEAQAGDLVGWSPWDEWN